jgi:cation diffusion facilitator family transporter
VVAGTTCFTSSQRRTGARLALTGLIINFVLAATKIATGLLGNSYALIADGIESILDIFGSLVIWFGLSVASAPPDAGHPYGHGKAESVAAMVVAFMVMAAALALAVESVREIVTPHHAPAPFTLIVLVVVVATKELLFRTVMRASLVIGSAAVHADAWHHRSDAITSIAAFIGISIALLGGPGWEPADDWAALFACGLIGFNGWNLLRPALAEAMDAAPPRELEESIREVALSVPGVQSLDQCRVRKMGLELWVDIHIEVDGTISVRHGHGIAHAVKDAIRGANPSVADVLVHVEPAPAPKPS